MAKSLQPLILPVLGSADEFAACFVQPLIEAFGIHSSAWIWIKINSEWRNAKLTDHPALQEIKQPSQMYIPPPKKNTAHQNVI